MAGPDDPLLAGLVDDAALFPPGNAAMADALREHDARKDEPWSGAVGPFVCPAARVGELLAARGQHQAVLVSLVVDPAVPGVYDAVRAADAATGVVVLGIEAPLAALGEDGARVLGRGPAAVRTWRRSAPGFLEVPRDASVSALDLVRATGWHAAKYRTGGVTAAAHPSEAELAALRGGLRGAPAALQAHRRAAPRGARPTTRRGLRAARRAQRAGRRRAGASRRQTAPGSRRSWPSATAHMLAKEVRSWTRAEGKAVRDRFRSFGCCGVEEPLGELRALGVLEDERAIW